MYNMLTSLVHDKGLSLVEFKSSKTVQGPVSKRADAAEEAPGPPLSQTAKGTLVESFLA